MSYRTITVAQKTYQYSVGKSFTKIKNVGVFHNSDIGDLVKDTCEKFVVTPYNVANVIKGEHKPRIIYKCYHGMETHKLTLDPYALEIYEEKTYMPACPKCIHQSYMDI